MRRTVTVFLLALVTAAALSTAALAKEGGVELSSTPIGKSPGEVWITNLFLIDGSPEMLAQAKPGIQVTNLDTGRQIDYPAETLAKGTGDYTVRVVFPEAGTWAYSAYDGVTGRMYEFPAVEITGPAAAPTAPTVKTPAATAKAPSSAGDVFPVWPLIAGLSAFALASAAAAVIIRRRRLRPSH
jgi:hypothetical protein